MVNKVFKKLEIENKLAELRQKWVKEPLNRPLIERRAKLLKMALGTDAYETAKQIFNE